MLQLPPQNAITFSFILYFSRTDRMWLTRISEVSPVRFWNSITFTWIHLVGAKYLTKGGTNFMFWMIQRICHHRHLFCFTQIIDHFAESKRSKHIDDNTFTFCSCTPKFFWKQISYDAGCAIYGSKWMIVLHSMKSHQSFLCSKNFLSFSASCDVIQEVSLWLSLFAAAASLYFFFAICCVMSERPPCSKEKLGPTNLV